MTRDLRHPIFARLYPRLDRASARVGGADHRTELLAGARGRVLEVGAGYGANFAHYPGTVDEVVAVEPEPNLRGQAERAAATAAVPVTVRPGVAERIDAKDGEFDTAVASLVLCSVRDVRRALAELHRVLRPGGELRFYEHIRGDTPGMLRLQRCADLLWPLIAAGCHVTRPTVDSIGAAGFTVRIQRRFRFPDDHMRRRVPHPAAPHVIGVAVRD